MSKVLAELGGRYVLEHNIPGMGQSALSALFRPAKDWFAGVQAKVERAGIQGLDVYGAFKGVDDALQVASPLRQKLRGDYLAITHGLEPDAHYGLASLLGAEERHWGAGSSELNLGTDMLAKARSLAEWDDQLFEQTGVSLRDGLRKSQAARQGISIEGDDIWDRAIRRGEFDPTDGHLDRVAARALNSGIQEKFLKAPLENLETVMNWRGRGDQYVLGPVRPAIRNYMNFVEGIPDQSARILQAFIGDMIGKVNNGLRKLGLREIQSNEGQMLRKLSTFAAAANLGAKPSVFIR